MAYSVKAVLRSVCWILQKKTQRYFWSTRIVWYNYPFTADASADFWLLLQCREHALNAGVDLNGYRPVTFDELVVAKEMDLLTDLKNYEPSELVHFGGSTYCTRTHGSLKVTSTGKPQHRSCGKVSFWERD